MQGLIQSINWATIEVNLPIITFLLVAVPLTLLLWADFLKVAAKNKRRFNNHEVKVLSRLREKDGSPIYVTIFGEPAEKQTPVASIIDFESRRVAAMRSGRNKQWR